MRLTALRPALPLFVLTMLLCACGNQQRAQRSVSITVAHEAEAPLVVESRNGSVEIVRDTTISDVQITASLRAAAKTMAEAQARVNAIAVNAARTPDRTLVVKPVFPGARQSGDGASFAIHVPSALEVRVTTSNGRVTVTGMRGEAVIDTSNGSVVLTDHAGPSRIDTSNGGVTIERQRGGATVKTSNGRVRLVGHGGEANVVSSNGSIELDLLNDAPGPFSLRTSNGSVTVHLGPAFVGRIVYDTSNGSARITDPNGRVRAHQATSKTDGNLTVGDGSGVPKSEIDTSNGTIRITFD